jgi:hypothetical protein
VKINKYEFGSLIEIAGVFRLSGGRSRTCGAKCKVHCVVGTAKRHNDGIDKHSRSLYGLMARLYILL